MQKDLNVSSCGRYAEPAYPPHKKLTPEDRDRLMKEGRCFYCKELGHTTLTCPIIPRSRAAGRATSGAIQTVDEAVEDDEAKN